MSAKVEVKCVACGHRQWIALANRSELPMCSKCFAPTVAIAASYEDKS
jgi:hypothetical protein